MALNLTPHHAYFIVGPSEPIVAELRAVRPRDWFYQVVTTFGIDESRALREQQTHRVAENEERFFIIVAEFLTVDAQNALLKMLEEPGRGNRFFFIIPSVGFLLPTLVSRGEIVNYAQEPAPPDDLINGFTESKFSGRLEIIKQVLDQGADDDSGVLRKRALEFVIGLSRWYLREGVLKNTAAVAWLLCGQELARAEIYLQKNGSVSKLVLEHLALIWPSQD